MRLLIFIFMCFLSFDAHALPTSILVDREHKSAQVTVPFGETFKAVPIAFTKKDKRLLDLVENVAMFDLNRRALRYYIYIRPDGSIRLIDFHLENTRGKKGFSTKAFQGERLDSQASKAISKLITRCTPS